MQVKRVCLECQRKCLSESGVYEGAAQKGMPDPRPSRVLMLR